MSSNSNALIVAADSAASGSFEIDFSGDIAVSSSLEAINLESGVTLKIDGEGLALDGKDDSTSASYDQRGLFVYSGAVNIDNLTIENMVANGGSGGAGGGGGGGAGLGGGLFVADNAAADGGTDPNAVASQVSLDDVTFELDSATGGAGAAPAAAAAAAGAVWAAPQEALVSMAGAALAAPAAELSAKGQSGIVWGAPGGGNGSSLGGAAGGGGGGGRLTGTGGGGGGIGAGAGEVQSNLPAGGAGGFGGGGGGGGGFPAAGGFGGGGAWDDEGGFGGGGGAFRNGGFGARQWRL